MTSGGAGARPATFAEVFAVAEFRALWIAQSQSRIGDQLARVALSLLVYEATSSASLTAATYALTYLPPLISGPLLTGLADRYPRRTLMVATDIASAALVGVMAIPGIPLGVLVVLLAIMIAIQPLFAAARTATVPQLLGGDRFVVGLGLLNVTDQVTQVLGFACGGILVGFIGPHAALAIDAITFAIAAVLLRWGLRQRPAAGDSNQPFSALASIRLGARLIWSDPRLRALTMLAWLYGFYVVPEGLAAPFADQLGGGAITTGLLMAAVPVGAASGALLLTRWVTPDARARLITPLAILCGVPLALTILRPPTSLALLLWVVSGLLSTYIVLGLGAFVSVVPDSQRGQAIGLANSGLQAAQGLGIALSGVVADLTQPSTAVAIFGLLGTIGCTFAGLSWNRANLQQGAACSPQH
jgi:predicted MFS family arabinose efflux permease